MTGSDSSQLPAENLTRLQQYQNDLDSMSVTDPVDPGSVRSAISNGIAAIDGALAVPPPPDGSPANLEAKANAYTKAAATLNASVINPLQVAQPLDVDGRAALQSARDCLEVVHNSLRPAGFLGWAEAITEATVFPVAMAKEGMAAYEVDGAIKQARQGVGQMVSAATAVANAMSDCMSTWDYTSNQFPQLVAALNSLPPGQQAEFDSLVAQVKNPVMAAALLSNLGNGTTVPEIKQALEAGEIIS